jgi:hypothetical protein
VKGPATVKKRGSGMAPFFIKFSMVAFALDQCPGQVNSWVR